MNEKFEQLLQVLEEAEVTSGLEPPAAAEGQAAGSACINGRRVEVLSRTITVLKKLLRERRDACSSSSAGVAHGEGSSLADSNGGGRAKREETLPVASTAAAIPAGPASRCVASVCPAGPAEDSAACSSRPTKAPASMGAAAGSASIPTVVHHVALPVPGHPTMALPPGFAGLAGGMSGGAPHGMPGHGQPIFIAVPMYMPPSQGMASIDMSTQTQAPTPAAASAMTATAAPATEASTVVAAPAADVGKPGVGLAGKEAWAMPHGMAFQSMMALQMPQFVTQALSAEEGDEKPTHAMCA